MNHEEQCGIARDLMPLVIDGVAGEASRQLVEAHLADCPDCRRVMEDMSAEIKARGGATSEKDEKFIRFCLKLRRGLSWKRALKVIPVVLVAVFGIAYLQYRLTIPDIPYIPTAFAIGTNVQDYLLLAYTSDGRESGITYRGGIPDEAGIAYLTPLTSGWSWLWRGTGPDESVIIGEYRFIDGQLMRETYLPVDPEELKKHSTPEGKVNWDAVEQEILLVEVKELRLGTPEKYIVAYRAGDTPNPMLNNAHVGIRNGDIQLEEFLETQAVPTQSPEILF
ncbi:MAG: zf-HC2 domain-containing protein [Oscillospiraceae bacterium]|jgi:hypothetical protein|nr:zf-HC2 domain-containing protein [Oscillospiraceae bacterium]